MRTTSPTDLAAVLEAAGVRATRPRERMASARNAELDKMPGVPAPGEQARPTLERQSLLQRHHVQPSLKLDARHTDTAPPALWLFVTGSTVRAIWAGEAWRR
jgi:hypothetical protein